MTCDIADNGGKTYSFYRDDTALATDLSDSKYVIADVTVGDSGQYSCLYTPRGEENSIMSTSHSVTVGG